jgi:hypothetical protein
MAYSKELYCGARSCGGKFLKGSGEDVNDTPLSTIRQKYVTEITRLKLAVIRPVAEKDVGMNSRGVLGRHDRLARPLFWP